MKKAPGILVSLLLATRLFALSMDTSWDFGAASDVKPLIHLITVTNDEKSALAVRLLPSCDCITVKPAVLALGPGTKASVSIAFDPAGYSGAVEKVILVEKKAGSAEAVSSLFTVRGTITPLALEVPSYPGECEWCKKQSVEFRRKAYESWRKQPSVVHYYFSPDCGSCRDFLGKEVPRLEKSLKRTIEIDKQDIGSPGVLKELDGIMKDHKTTLRALPVLVIGGKILQGEKEIRAGFEPELRALKTAS